MDWQLIYEIWMVGVNITLTITLFLMFSVKHDNFVQTFKNMAKFKPLTVATFIAIFVLTIWPYIWYKVITMNEDQFKHR